MSPRGESSVAIHLKCPRIMTRIMTRVGHREGDHIFLGRQASADTLIRGGEGQLSHSTQLTIRNFPADKLGAPTFSSGFGYTRTFPSWLGCCSLWPRPSPPCRSPRPSRWVRLCRSHCPACAMFMHGISEVEHLCRPDWAHAYAELWASKLSIDI